MSPAIGRYCVGEHATGRGACSGPTGHPYRTVVDEQSATGRRGARGQQSANSSRRGSKCPREPRTSDENRA